MTPYRAAIAPLPRLHDEPVITAAMVLRAVADAAWDYALALGPVGIVVGGIAVGFASWKWSRRDALPQHRRTPVSAVPSTKATSLARGPRARAVARNGRATRRSRGDGTSLFVIEFGAGVMLAVVVFATRL